MVKRRPSTTAAMAYTAETADATGGYCRAGIRHRQLARLGGQRHGAARRKGGGRPKLRTHPPLEPRRHGRVAAAIQGRHNRANRSSSTARKSIDVAGPGRGAQAAAGSDACASRGQTGRRKTCRCVAASIRLSKSTITSTAGFCPMCCGSCCPRRSPDVSHVIAESESEGEGGFGEPPKPNTPAACAPQPPGVALRCSLLNSNATVPKLRAL